MRIKIVLASLVLIAIVVSVSIYFMGQAVPIATPEVNLEFVSFTNAEGVTFMLAPTAEGILFSGLGYINLPLATATSASGTRYENNALKLVVWDNGDELSVYQHDDLVFAGTKGTVAPVTPVEVAATSSPGLDALTLLTSYTWQWQEEGPPAGYLEENPFTLLYQADGTLIVGTDCNGFRASYDIATTTFTLTHSNFMGTKMACPDSKEAAYLENLTGITNFYFSQGLDLILKSDDGTDLYFVPQLIQML